MAATQTLPLTIHVSHCPVGASGRAWNSVSSSNVRTVFSPAHILCRKAALQKRRIGWRNGSVRAQANPTALVAKELERVAAKESLLLSIKDSGGLQGLMDSEADAQARMDVNEKILALERLNPTPRPTTGLPSSLASISSLTLVIRDGVAKATGHVKLFNMVESDFILTTNLEIEGPMRVKEEYVEGLVAAPTVMEGTIPSQLKGVLDQFSAAVQQLPDTIKDMVSSGVKLPLNNTFKRELLISYLDEQVMIARDKSGTPDVLVRVEFSASDASLAVLPEYVS